MKYAIYIKTIGRLKTPIIFTAIQRKFPTIQAIQPLRFLSIIKMLPPKLKIAPRIESIKIKLI